jgi:hypothetical protein
VANVDGHLISYRGFDTLGEVAVLSCAASIGMLLDPAKSLRQAGGAPARVAPRVRS